MNAPHPPDYDPEASPRPCAHWQRRLLAGCCAGAVVFGMVGFLQYDHVASPTNALYHTAQLFLLHTAHFEKQPPPALEIGRWLAAATTGLAVLGVIRRMFHEERTALSLRRLSGHVIICGLGQKGLDLALRLRAKGQTVVVVDKAPPPDLLGACRRAGTHVLTGDATRAEVLREARVQHARSLVALCPEDGANCEVAAQVCHLRSAPGASATPFDCHVHLGDTDLRATLQQFLSAHPQAGRPELQFFDAYDPQARQLLTHVLPLDHDGISAQEPRRAHLVILGFGRMGRALAVRAAQLGHFGAPARLRVSVIDRRAEANRAALLFRHPRILEVCDLEFHALEALSPDTRALLERWCADPHCLTSLAVCFDNEQLALEIAVQLLPLLKTRDVRMALRMAGRSGLARLIEEPRLGSGLLGRVHTFSVDQACCRVEGDSAPAEQFARHIHAEYTRARRHPAHSPAPDPLPADDPALQDWDRLPEDLRDSNRQQAAHLFMKLRSIGCQAAPIDDPRPAAPEFSAAQIDELARIEHRRWVAERLIAGWTRGPVKNIDRRENPNLVPWQDLPQSVKEYDRMMVRLIPRLLAAVQLKICHSTPAG